MIVKTNVSGFIRDTKTGLVSNTNKASFEQMKAQRERDKEIKSLRNEVDVLKIQVAELLKLKDV